MRAALICLACVLLLSGSAAGGQSEDAVPIVDQLLAQATALDLSAGQVKALERIRDRRVHTLATLQERLRGAEAQQTAAAAEDTVTLMREIGRVQVLSGREALQQLSPAQRRRWVELHAARTP
jgi:hypothetical protein